MTNNDDCGSYEDGSARVIAVTTQSILYASGSIHIYIHISIYSYHFTETAALFKLRRFKLEQVLVPHKSKAD